jgi:hypothetical protein
MRRFPVTHLDVVVSQYRQHAASMSRDPAAMLRAALRVLGAQRPATTGNKYYRRALESGVRDWKHYYGEQIVDRVNEHLENGEWLRAVAGIFTLGRLYPSGLRSCVPRLAMAVRQPRRVSGIILPEPARPLVLRSIAPAETAAGVGFNLQPTGQSGLSVVAEHANPWTVAMLGTTPLTTVYNSASSLSVLVPAELLQKAGTYPLVLHDGARESNRLEFRVTSFGKPLLKQLSPARTTARLGFNIQPDGQSALAVEAASAAPDTIIVWGRTPLETVYHDPTFLTARVPAELYAQPGRYPVYLQNTAGRSDPREFLVEEEHARIRPSGPPRRALSGPPVLERLYPHGTRAGAAFNVQPDGQSAIAVDARNAPPDTTVVFGGRPLETVYHDPSFLTALVPSELYAQPGRYEVYLDSTSGKSEKDDFVAEP